MNKLSSRKLWVVIMTNLYLVMCFIGVFIGSLTEQILGNAMTTILAVNTAYIGMQGLIDKNDKSSH